MFFNLLLSKLYQQDPCVCRILGSVNLKILLSLKQHSNRLCFLMTPRKRQIDLAKVEQTNICREHKRVNAHPARLQFCFCLLLNNPANNRELRIKLRSNVAKMVT